MTDLKPNIFIGSSGTGYEYATKVKDCLNGIANCILWQEPGVWEPNRSTFDNLLRMVSFFDFGIFVATADDLTLTKDDKIVIEPRDNVILEMALFLGALGKHKSFLLVEEGVKLPSDFKGIYMPRFKRADNNAIEAACKEFSATIEEHYKLGHLSLYPTTALAIGYYKNFIAGLVDSVQNTKVLKINNLKFTKFKLKVIMPKDLKGLIREKADQFYRRHGFIENTMETKFRKHPAWFHIDEHHAPQAIMYDMPSTLTGVDDAIEMILQKGFQGRTQLQEVIEQRELNNFRRVLQIQIDRSPFAQEIVEIVDEF
ncbi:STING domain-containing protein [Daejeonella lutea]|uniref:CD-NTase-associated protein 12 n=1 Tax=Daejeonella lutea TaxID=572036 RepID=A0A1T4ZWI1_9SPHI|nr:STING domain-containing protein [Daejeonella lutea]SKB27114.1 Predicted nucleotide-binding protein containing TIR-like domain-containing protein [Daejeonella lutea]